MIRCGFSKTLITPKLGTVMAGTMELKYTEGVLDDLYARAISFDDGEKKALLVSIDLCHMGTDVNNECRKRISCECGIDYDAIMLTCTHTHAGPVTTVEGAVNIRYRDEDVKRIKEYRDFLIERICEAARGAFENSVPSKFYIAVDKAEGIAHVRRYRLKDGSVATNPGMDWNSSGDPITCCPIPDNTDVLEALGRPNETVKILKILREGEKDICLVNYALHATTAHVRKVSADFPGKLCSIVERAIDGVECVFLQSAQGDICQINRYPSEAEKKFLTEDNENAGETLNKARHVAQVLAASVLKNYMTAREIDANKISFGAFPLELPANKKPDDNYEEALRIQRLHEEGRHHELPYQGMELVTVLADARRIVRMNAESDTFRYSYFAIAFEDLVFLGLPGEFFAGIGDGILESSPYANTLLCAITNVKSTYFLTDAAYLEGGYEALTCNTGIGTEKILIQGAKKFLEDLKG